MRKIQRLAAVGTMAVLTAVMGACSNAQEPATGVQSSAAPQPGAQSESNPGAMTPRGNGVTQSSDIFGPACDQIPKDGQGSAKEMATTPVATAASHNPLLSSTDPTALTLTKAVMAANLTDTLNNARALTVFAPANSAFADFEAQHPGMLKALTSDPKVASADSNLAKILKYHVVEQRYDAAGLIQAGTVESMLQGAKIKIGGTAAAPTVNGAPVLCGNIPTRNATVFVIGQVLSPPAT